jgi:hypothetical protein
MRTGNPALIGLACDVLLLNSQRHEVICITESRRPYSPELNPEEQVWNCLKHNGVAKAGLRSGKDLRKYVLERLRSLQRLPGTILMLFLMPDT